MEGSAARLVNSTTVESATGLRSINLYQGDICAATDELLVISSHAGNDSLTGMVVDALTEKYSLDFSLLAPVVTLEDHPYVGTFRNQLKCLDQTHPAKEILVVRIPGAEVVKKSSSEPMEVYDEAVWTLFGALAAWEQKGVCFSSMAMPLLAGRRGYPEQQIMEVILRRSANWLKSSQTMKSINLYLYSEQQLKTWSDAMNSALGRRVIDSAKDSIVQALRDEILVLIKSSGKLTLSPLGEVVDPLANTLSEKQICLQQVSTIGRKLVEVIVDQLITERKLESKGTLVNNITMLNYEQVIAPWIASHFHALRVFGNETVHAKSEVKYRPKSLQDDDLVAVLTSLRSVLQFYCHW
jgi:hypothetical protein